MDDNSKAIEILLNMQRTLQKKLVKGKSSLSKCQANVDELEHQIGSVELALIGLGYKEELNY